MGALFKAGVLFIMVTVICMGPRRLGNGLACLMAQVPASSGDGKRRFLLCSLFSFLHYSSFTFDGCALRFMPHEYHA